MRLRELRLEKGLSKNKLAKLAGISQTAVTFIEEGQRSPTHPQHAEAPGQGA